MNTDCKRIEFIYQVRVVSAAHSGLISLLSGTESFSFINRTAHFIPKETHTHTLTDRCTSTYITYHVQRIPSELYLCIINNFKINIDQSEWDSYRILTLHFYLNFYIFPIYLTFWQYTYLCMKINFLIFFFIYVLRLDPFYAARNQNLPIKHPFFMPLIICLSHEINSFGLPQFSWQMLKGFEFTLKALEEDRCVPGALQG